MLLTLKPSSPPAQNGINPSGTQEYSVVRQSIPSLRDSTAPATSPFRRLSGPPSPTTIPAGGSNSSAVVQQQPPPPQQPLPPGVMDPIASSRRDLPPPASRTLPPPPSFTAPPLQQQQQQQQQQPPPQQQQQSQQLPPPPPPSSLQHVQPQWQNPEKDVSMHLWLQARAEEDRRRQEEEKVRQETLRLEQRVVEHSMLRDALQAGVPPHMVPLIFAGISNGGLPQSILELTQQFMTQQGQPHPSGSLPQPMPPPPPHQHQHHGHQRHQSTSGLEMSASALPAHPQPLPSQRYPQPAVPSDIRRNSHTLPSNAVYPTQQPVMPPGETLPSQPMGMPPGSSGSSPVKQSLGHSAFPAGPPSRVNEVPGHYAGTGSNPEYAPGSGAAPPQSTFGKEYQYRPRQSSTSIYFHHWVPPGQGQSSTPGGKGSQESSVHSHSHSNSRSEYQSSPGRKRKSQGPHQPAPLPSSLSRQSSPAGSRRPSRPSHRRQQSDVSMANEPRAPEYIESEHSQSGSKPTGPPPTGDTASEKAHARESSSSQGQSVSAGPDGSGSNSTSDYGGPKRDGQPGNPPFTQSYSSDRATSKTPPKTTASMTDDDEEPVKPGDHR